MPRYPSQGSYYSGNDRIGDLIRERGNIAAQSALESGDLWGRAIPGIVNQLGGIANQYFQQREELKAKKEEEERQTARGKAFEAAIDSGDVKALFKILPPRDAEAVVKALQANTPQGAAQYSDRMEVLRDTALGIKKSPAESRANMWAKAIPNLLQNKIITPEEAQGFGAYDPGQLDAIAGYGEKGETTKTPILHKVTMMGPGGVPVTKGVTDEELMAGVPEYVKPEKPAGPKDERIVQVLKDGVPTWVRESEAIGKPTAEAGKGRELKPILSGDIEDLASMQESIDLAKGLSESLKGKIGSASRIGAALPDFITEATGLGAESKGTQAKIGVARQIIGKGLEGGVLRKEDEAKYEKMLPKIGDSDEVANEKIQNLVTAIQNKMNRRLEALEDAGRDVSAYRRRQGTMNPPRISDPSQLASLPSGSVFIAPDGSRKVKP